MPDFYLIGGPNGAGKTTIALQLLPAWGCHEFVNADSIAAALSPFEPESVALQAGVLMMKRLHDLAARGINFGTESTLAARAFVPFIRDCQDSGYRFNLCYVWLPGVEMAIERVAARVQSGGHSIPEETIRRRYEMGRINFWQLYAPLADYWIAFNNAKDSASTIAEGKRSTVTKLLQPDAWRQITA